MLIQTSLCLLSSFLSVAHSQVLQVHFHLNFQISMQVHGSGKMLPNRSEDRISVSSSDNCEDSSAFLAEGTSVIILETISVRTFAL